MRSWSLKLKRILALLRFTRVMLIIGILAILASAVVGLFWPKYFFIAYAISTIFVIIPLIAFAFLVSLPLKAKSIVRLIDMGYPANARELAIRFVARKLHEESIATEELLWDTAVNEGKKFVRKMEADKARRQGERQGGAAGTGAGPGGTGDGSGAPEGGQGGYGGYGGR
jgi:cytochrome c biogenesis protein CcdA